MGGIRKLVAKDKHWFIRGSIVLGLMLALFALLITQIFSQFQNASVAARAEDTVSRVVTRFEQMIHDAFINAYGTAELIAGDSSREAMFIEALCAYSRYSEVGVLYDGVIRHIDGTTNTIEVASSRVYSVNDEIQGRFITLKDGSILICVAIDENSELVVRYEPADVAEILNDAFSEDYGFAVYNASTGAYFVNNTSFSENGYYDALLALNANSATSGLLNNETNFAHIGAGSKSFYIVQQSTGIRPWNIAMVMPDSMVAVYAEEYHWLPCVAMAAALLLLAAHVLFVLVAMRRMRADDRSAELSFKDSTRLLSEMSREAGVTLLIYHRGQDNLMWCYDGLDMFGSSDASRKLTTLRAVEEACGLNNADAERLHGRMRELAHGSTAELMLRCVLRDREERLLRFDLSTYPNDESVIVCAIRDCTQEMLVQGRADTEQSYLEANMERSAAVWEINVTRNLWRCRYLRAVDEFGVLGRLEGREEWRDFTNDLGGVLREHIHPADYAEHVQKMSIPAIAGYYRAGRPEVSLDYRVRSSRQGDYVWHRMQVHLYPDPETGDILANTYIFNVDMEKNVELEKGERNKVFQKTLRALSGIYYALYYVDLDNDLCYAAKSHDGEVVTRICTPFRETFDQYLESVHPEDREELRPLLDSFSMRRMFVEGSRFQRKEYRRRSGDGYRWAAIIIQPARYENGRIKDVVIAMRNLVDPRYDLE